MKKINTLILFLQFIVVFITAQSTTHIDTNKKSLVLEIYNDIQNGRDCFNFEKLSNLVDKESDHKTINSSQINLLHMLAPLEKVSKDLSYCDYLNNLAILNIYDYNFYRAATTFKSAASCVKKHVGADPLTRMKYQLNVAIIYDILDEKEMAKMYFDNLIDQVKFQNIDFSNVSFYLEVIFTAISIDSNYAPYLKDYVNIHEQLLERSEYDAYLNGFHGLLEAYQILEKNNKYLHCFRQYNYTLKKHNTSIDTSNLILYYNYAFEYYIIKGDIDSAYQITQQLEKIIKLDPEIGVEQSIKYLELIPFENFCILTINLNRLYQKTNQVEYLKQATKNLCYILDLVQTFKNRKVNIEDQYFLMQEFMRDLGDYNKILYEAYTNKILSLEEVYTYMQFTKGLYLNEMNAKRKQKNYGEIKAWQLQILDSAQNHEVDFYNLVKSFEHLGIKDSTTTHTISPIEIQNQLSKEDIILDYYFLGTEKDSFLFVIFFITNSSIEVQKTLVSQGNMENFLTFISQNPMSKDKNFYIKNMNGLSKITNLLYKELLLSNAENYDKWIIIPSNRLYAFPFHALTNNQKYLIETQNIQYAFTPDWYFRNQPSFQERNTLLIKESELGNDFQETQFIQASSTQIIGINNALTRLKRQIQSKEYTDIYFACHSSYEPNKGLPYISQKYQIPIAQFSDLDLSNKRIWLPNCESHKGPFKSADGFMSFAYKFASQNASSILSGLWKIPDFNSSLILENTYLHHTSSAQSLQHGVQNYLNEQKGVYRHPYFWAGLLVFEKNLPHSKKHQSYLYPVLISLLALIAGLFLYKRVK